MNVKTKNFPAPSFFVSREIYDPTPYEVSDGCETDDNEKPFEVLTVRYVLCVKGT